MPLWFGTRAEFWQAYDGDEQTINQAAGRLRELWDKLCECDPPAIRNPDAKLFLSSDPAVFDNTFNIVQTGHRCSLGGVEEEIARAVATIRSNFDLVTWLACILNPDLGACLKNYWINISDKRKIHFDVGSWGTKDAAAVTLEELAGCRIRIATNYFCDSYLKPLRTSGESKNTRTCAMIRLAGFLLHESVHCCASETGFRDRTTTGDSRFSCANSYLVQNMFTFFMSHRHDCSENRNSSRFFSDS